MKLEMQMTERDKKLLIFLAVFVIIVGIGYWGIVPIITGVMDINDQIEEQEDLRNLNELKIAEIPILEIDNKELEEEVDAVRVNFYPMMDSSEVDKYMTGLALSYNLYAYDLSIDMPEKMAHTEAYQYSEKYIEDQYQAEMEAAMYDAEASGNSEESQLEQLDTIMSSESEFTDYDEQALTGIYEVNVSMRLGGSEKALQSLIDDLSVNEKEILLKAYHWSDTQELKFDPEAGDYIMESERTLTISLSFYMCDEEEKNNQEDDEVNG